MVGKSSESSVNQRFCQDCGYSLFGLDKPCCPECGRHFNPDDPATYSSSAHRLTILDRMIVRLTLPAAISAMALYALVVWYCYQNESAHSGLDWSLLFIPFSLLAGILAYSTWKKHRVLSAGTGLAFSISGLVLSQLLKPFGIMLTYEEWIRAGMHDPTYNRDVFLALTISVPAIVSFVLAGIILIARINNKSIRGRVGEASA